MDVRVTIEIDGKKYGMLYKGVETIQPGELGRVIEATINNALGRRDAAMMPVEERN